MSRKTDRVAEHLLRRIVSGELSPGAVLPREADLAEVFRVNRSVVREALKRLEVHRLVRPIKRRGTIVLDRRKVNWLWHSPQSKVWYLPSTW